MQMGKLKLIDSHAHVNFEAFEKDRREVIDKALEAGVWMINIGSDFETSRKATEISQDYSNGVYTAVGVHPIHVLDETYDEQCMLDLINNNEKVIAVGETGLDYFHIFKKEGKLQEKAGKSDKLIKKQKELFKAHLRLARISNLPLVLHVRSYHKNDAYWDMLNILQDFKKNFGDYDLRGVIHCYGGNSEIANTFLKLGFYIGFTGIITFSGDYDKLIEKIDLKKILVETDCPYLSPVPKRGQRNTPNNVELVADKIAQIKGLDRQEVYDQTTKNCFNLFKLI
ncbi:MAG: YchF/TatD family DNA exonuclease [Candidatus Moranbacteria bacterium]|nr:YchF/TatD family DNA exonuclease [Candidatus Moranbacteria bacterium]